MDANCDNASVWLRGKKKNESVKAEQITNCSRPEVPTTEKSSPAEKRFFKTMNVASVCRLFFFIYFFFLKKKITSTGSKVKQESLHHVPV